MRCGRFASLKTIKRQAKTGDFATIDLLPPSTVKRSTPFLTFPWQNWLGHHARLVRTPHCVRPTQATSSPSPSTLKGGEHEGEEQRLLLTVKSVKERSFPRPMMISLPDGFRSSTPSTS